MPPVQAGMIVRNVLLTVEARLMRVVEKFILQYKIRGDTYKGYEKFCWTESRCNGAKTGAFCKEKDVCKVHCCRDDFCNTAAMQVVSVVSLVLCAFLSSVMIQ